MYMKCGVLTHIFGDRDNLHNIQYKMYEFMIGKLQSFCGFSDFFMASNSSVNNLNLIFQLISCRFKMFHTWMQLHRRFQSGCKLRTQKSWAKITSDKLIGGRVVPDVAIRELAPVRAWMHYHHISRALSPRQ